ncbi:MAG: valine--tRNA ligase [Deltaproteobacteria bacterium]|jgi:valyl-tRNA synthetase|nr:valine--tRNA ligase [Deltaproteobacteria bacterium]
MPLSETKADEGLEKNFNFSEAEPRLYQMWEQGGYFAPEPKKTGPKFSIVIPPPNVTGNLHMGHALDVTLQDILTRYHRLKGDDTVWIPGCDHAGIATQAVVERALAAEGLEREKLGREKFVERVWQWKETYGSNIVRQLRRLGASCDWSRERFTLDEGLSKAVREVFVSLYEEGLIYRGERIINWCPHCRTAVSDIEVEHEDRADYLYYLKYPLQNKGEYLTVATARPETIFGDTALAINPNDTRHQVYLGQMAQVPLTSRLVPIIADDYVSMEFGTGCLKVTPAHDPNDFLIGRHHNLPIILAIDQNGLMTNQCGSLAGVEVSKARELTLKLLEDNDFFIKSEPLNHAVGLCYRCRTAVEPLVSKQWFVSSAPLALEASKAVREGRVKLHPASWEKTYFEWLDNIRDWCVSRQLWWGHQIPAWYCQRCAQTVVSREDPTICTSCGGELQRDPDVLDTWFSSALWPFSTLGWPNKTADLERYYPTSVLVTGFDILFFWVARMIMMGLKMTAQEPFLDVVLHPLVRDETGQKMSKSKGNAINPLEVLDRHGADAFRFTLASQAGPTRDLRLNAKRVEGYSKFVNKLWNASRFAFRHLGLEPLLAKSPPSSFPDRWIFSRLSQVIEEINTEIAQYHFDRYCDIIYQFTWYEFCDWYLELIKPILYQESQNEQEATKACLALVLCDLLTIIHPVMPFVTSEIYARLFPSAAPLMLRSFPQSSKYQRDQRALTEAAFLMDLTKAVRQARSDFGVPPAAKLSPIVSLSDPLLAELMIKQAPLLLNLMGAASLRVAEKGESKPKEAAVNILDWGQVWTPLTGHIDAEAERARLTKEALKLEKDIDSAQKKLSNQDYLTKAPEEIVEETREKLVALDKRLQAVKRSQELIGDLT